MSLRRALIPAVLPALGLLGACSGGSSSENIVKSDKQRETTPSVSATDVASAAASERGFAVDVYEQLATTKQNLFFSPHSIAEALMMTYAGARTTTATQMHDVLHLALSDDKSHAAMNALDLALASRGQGQKGQDGQPFRLRVANAIWGQDGFSFEPSYLDTIALDYGAGVQLLDFAADPEKARVHINDWVAGATEDKIHDLLPTGVVTQDTRLVLTNAVYFNAAWAEKFEKVATRNEAFHLKDGSTSSSSTMVHTATYGYYAASGVAAVSLPYAGNELSMVVVRPDDLAAFEATLSQPVLDAIVAGMQPSGVTLHLPRWKFTDETSLSQTLQALGMTDAFGDADFSGIDGQRDLAITDVLHKAFVGVDEDGTEAAAATAVVVGETSVQVPEVELKVDRPFVFFIRDNATGAIVFLGRVLDPSAS